MGEKLNSNQNSEKETDLERLAYDSEKAQEMPTMGSWVLDVDTGEVTWTAGLHKISGQNPSCPSHKIRSPMNGMIGFANLLQEEGARFEDQR
ncbi:hypothetical protein [Pelagicoccus sp. SDUM812002]|uniref:hypothetical protein n=1 Tax=Pelagicoccus sp. SDUM812002 TaxID=3041266 RepID=UPI00280E8B82|nr:hypothetical protein [Pelagicoccus sp. SDUM812002]MDQ8185818.1 hypothetical protein [Pelagicoccus sp. SDUM812002]